MIEKRQWPHIGEIRSYYMPEVGGERTQRMVVLGCDGKTVVCVPECFYVGWHNPEGREVQETFIRRIPLDKFEEWYPHVYGDMDRHGSPLFALFALAGWALAIVLAFLKYKG